MDEAIKQIGERLKGLREVLNIPAEEIAELCEISRCKIMVGGAVLTPEYAEKIGADWYAKDAKRSADIAKEFFGV